MPNAGNTVKAVWEMVCPKCGDDSRLDIAASVWVRLTPDGTDADLAHDGSHEWDNASPCHCAACNWTGQVVDATYFGKAVSA